MYIVYLCCICALFVCIYSVSVAGHLAVDLAL
jgi:hypothetical protein